MVEFDIALIACNGNAEHATDHFEVKIEIMVIICLLQVRIWIRNLERFVFNRASPSIATE